MTFRLLWSLFIGLGATFAQAGELRFRDFSGVCQAGSPDGELWTDAIGWNRFDFNWSKLEPRPGEWNETEFKRLCDRVLSLRQRGFNVLPVLAYCPSWAVTTGTVEYIDGNRKKVFVPQGNNLYQVTSYKKSTGGEWEKDKVKENVANPRLPIRPDQIVQWEKFVRKVVTKLHSPPYELQYFQVWNEASPKSGFWNGNLDDYIKNIHLPAAAAIRALGGKVVYGGWPDCEKVDGLVTLLDSQDAWKSIDVIDVHYYSFHDMARLYKTAVKRGFPQLAVWQTEIGFHSKYYYIPSFYPPTLHWALTTFPDRTDAVKVFFFAYGSPANPQAYGYGKCLQTGGKLSPHGQALKVLGNLFGNDPIKIFSAFECRTAELEKLSMPSFFGFTAGNRIIISIHLKKDHHPSTASQGNLEHLEMIFPKLRTEDVLRIERIGVFGETRILPLPPGPTVRINVPLREEVQGLYTAVVPPPDYRRPVMYLVLYLKGHNTGS